MALPRYRHLPILRRECATSFSQPRSFPMKMHRSALFSMIALASQACAEFSTPKEMMEEESGCSMTKDIAGQSACDCTSGACILASALIDLCPDDPQKTSPGFCGCNHPDLDENDNGIIDCIEEENDQCPDDPDKLIPGYCGCGTPDTDSDGDTVLDCLEECPQNPDKLLKGICGCAALDTEENMHDDDGDGVMNCLDACPQNPHKILALQSGCNVNDSDQDGFDDDVDACPTNPHIWYNPESPEYDVAELCLIDDSRVFHVYEPSDLQYLKNAEDVESIILETDINLNDIYENPYSHAESCHTIPQMLSSFPIYIDGNHKTLSYTTANGTRCKHHRTLFYMLNGANDLTIDIDFEGSMSSGFAETGTGIFTNIVYRGHYNNTTSPTDIIMEAGGLFLELQDCALNNVISDHAEFDARFVNFGVIAHRITHCTMNYTKPHIIERLEAGSATTSVAGFAYTGDRFSNIKQQIHTLSGNGAGFVVIGEQFDHIENTIDEVTSAAGFVNLIRSTNAELKLTDIKNHIETYTGSAPFVRSIIHMRGTTTISDIDNEIHTFTAQDFIHGSFISDLSMTHPAECSQIPLLTLRNTQNTVHTMTLTRHQNAKNEYISGGFIGRITHYQPHLMSLKSYCKDLTPSAAIEISHAISHIDTMNLTDYGSGFIGAIQLKLFPLSEFDMEEGLPSDLFPTLNLKNVLSIANMQVSQTNTENMGSVIGRIEDDTDSIDCGMESCAEYIENSHHAFPRWHAMTIQAFVSAGQWLTPQGKDKSHIMFGTSLSEVTSRFAEYSIEDSYYYNYTNEAQTNTAFSSMESPLLPSSQYAIKLLSFLHQHSPLWNYKEVLSRDTSLVLPVLEL